MSHIPKHKYHCIFCITSFSFHWFLSIRFIGQIEKHNRKKLSRLRELSFRSMSILLMSLIFDAVHKDLTIGIKSLRENLWFIFKKWVEVKIRNNASLQLLSYLPLRILLYVLFPISARMWMWKSWSTLHFTSWVWIWSSYPWPLHEPNKFMGDQPSGAEPRGHEPSSSNDKKYICLDYWIPSLVYSKHNKTKQNTCFF